MDERSFQGPDPKLRRQAQILQAAGVVVALIGAVGIPLALVLTPDHVLTAIVQWVTGLR